MAIPLCRNGTLLAHIKTALCIIAPILPCKVAFYPTDNPAHTGAWNDYVPDAALWLFQSSWFLSAHGSCQLSNSFLLKQLTACCFPSKQYFNSPACQLLSLIWYHPWICWEWVLSYRLGHGWRHWTDGHHCSMTWMQPIFHAAHNRPLNPKVQPSFTPNYCPFMQSMPEQLAGTNFWRLHPRSFKINIISSPIVPWADHLIIEENQVSETWSVLRKSMLADSNHPIVLWVPGNVLYGLYRD